MADETTTLVDVPQETTITANKDEGTTQLFNDNGATLFVLNSDVDYWVRQGFRKTQFNIDASRTELKAFLGAAAGAVDIFIDGVIKDAVIDPNDNANLSTAVTAMAKVFEIWNNLYADVFRKYPVVQGEE